MNKNFVLLVVVVLVVLKEEGSGSEGPEMLRILWIRNTVLAMLQMSNFLTADLNPDPAKYLDTDLDPSS
jgi:hypothetical protein